MAINQPTLAPHLPIEDMATQATRLQLDEAPAPAGTPETRARVALEQLEQVFADWTWTDASLFEAARDRARAHALDVFAAASGEEQIDTALLVAAADLISALRMELADSPRKASRLLNRIERLGTVPRIELSREVLRAPELLSIAPGEALKAQLGMLIAFAPLRSVSLWTRDSDERIECACHRGDGAPSRGEQQLAKKLLAGDVVEPGPRGLLFGVVVPAHGVRLGALVGAVNPGDRELSQVVVNESVPMLAAVIERKTLVAQNLAAHHALIEASERKLVRLGFDLHDGPIQDLAALADDLRLFRDQLELMLGSTQDRDLVRGRIEDLDAQLVSVDGELRRLSGEVQAASVLLNQPFRTALRQRVQAFAARTAIKPRLRLRGDMNLLSTSQQIALLNIIQESLSNIREHADASEVQISVSATHEGVKAKVVDDGRGFEIEPTLMRAAREGRIGLLAMNERVRLLGGECRIESSPGGPTVVSVTLEPWPPHADQAPGSRSGRRLPAHAADKAQASRA
jgi:signal transduction histidine kinase